MQQLYPPSLEKVEKEIAFHLEKDRALAPVFAVYKSILSAQLSYFDKINAEIDISPDGIKDCFRQGKYLLAEQQPAIDRDLFKGLLGAIIAAIRKASPEAPETLGRLTELDEFAPEYLDKFLQDIVTFNRQEMENYIGEKEIDKRAALDREIIAFALFMSLGPFFSRMMNRVGKEVGFNLWRRGYCPICGQAAVMARHRSEDGARVLGCWLCHAQWVFPRLECPYCDNKEQEKLRFFYVPGDRSHQVHVCEKCKGYLKTVDTRATQKDIVLEVEEIATARLDRLAEKEGYRPAARAFLLH